MILNIINFFIPRILYVYLTDRSEKVLHVTSRFFFFFYPLAFLQEKAMAPHSSTFAWKIPWMEEPGRLSPCGHWGQTRLSNFTFTFHFRALEKEMATHSSVLAWRIPGTGEPGRLPSMGSHRVGHNWSDLVAAAFLHMSGKVEGIISLFNQLKVFLKVVIHFKTIWNFRIISHFSFQFVNENEA